MMFQKQDDFLQALTKVDDLPIPHDFKRTLRLNILSMEIQSRREQVSSRREQASLSNSDDLFSYELYVFPTKRTERNVYDGESNSSSPSKEFLSLPEEGQREQKRAVERWATERIHINYITHPQGVYPLI